MKNRSCSGEVTYKMRRIKEGSKKVNMVLYKNEYTNLKPAETIIRKD
jgi:hypothetical protein